MAMLLERLATLLPREAAIDNLFPCFASAEVGTILTEARKITGNDHAFFMGEDEQAYLSKIRRRVRFAMSVHASSLPVLLLGQK